jgi:hypothetical protein
VFGNFLRYSAGHFLSPATLSLVARETRNVVNMHLERSDGEQAGNAIMSHSERIVTGFAAVLLIVGFATGAFVKPVNLSMHESALSAHVQAPQIHHRGWACQIEQE